MADAVIEAAKPYLGVITGFNTRFGSMYVDVVIDVAPPGTVGGDSGMLWKTERGAAVGIHAYGILASPDQRSLKSLCMWPRRAEQNLAVTLLLS